MQSFSNQYVLDDTLECLWPQVCAARSTPAPEPTQCGQFLQALGASERATLHSVLSRAAMGREKPGDLSLLSWAAACTRPALHSQLNKFGLSSSPAELFACSLTLQGRGWSLAAMSQRIAQLAEHPEDVVTMAGMQSSPDNQAGKAQEPAGDTYPLDQPGLPS